MFFLGQRLGAGGAVHAPDGDVGQLAAFDASEQLPVWRVAEFLCIPAQQFGEFGGYQSCPRVALGAVLELSAVALVAVIRPAALGVGRGVAEFTPAV